MDTPRTHKDLISFLGGPSELARKLGIYRVMPTTIHWAERGIPARYWHKVAALASKAEIQLTAHDVELMLVEEQTGRAA